MKRLSILSIALAIVIALSSITFLSSQPISRSPESPPVYIGISFCGNTTEQAKLLIDKTKGYTNLFVLQSGPISIDETAMTQICDYAVEQGLNIIVFFGWFNPEYPWQYEWVKKAPTRYGDSFLGIYYYDEPGGIQLDYDWTGHFTNVTRRLANMTVTRNITRYYSSFLDSIHGYLNGTVVNYDVEAEAYIDYMQHDRDLTRLRNVSIPAFTSDYALYWWDYLGGYNVTFAQLGNNASITQEINLVKGAAHMQNKQWGVILTWKYDEPPYLDSGEEIYKQMSMAYQAGAKYIILFDYPQIAGNPYGLLTEEHFTALETFWQDVMINDSLEVSTKTEAVLVLPRNYGWGMRHIHDRIWLWESDDKSEQIWNISRILLEKFGTNLDIVYDDINFPVENKYSQIYYWNQTVK